jgi:quercetin dioxygenase-like cupin family protein
MILLRYWLVLAMVGLTACSTTQVPEDSPLSEVPKCDPSEVGESRADDERATPLVGVYERAPRFLSATEEIAVVWLAEGKNAYLGELVLAPGTEVPMHTHDSEEYLFFMHGGGVMTIDGEEVEVGPGSVVLVPEKTEHAFVNGPDETIAIQIFADPEGAQRYRDWTQTDPN